MNPAMGLPAAAVYVGAIFLTLCGLLWQPLRNVLVLFGKIVWLYFLTGVRG
jgi:hypothetical protein